jgi:hypothetical protein
MKKLYSSQDRMMVNHLKNILETQGVRCLIKNDFLASAAGELPLTECWPELWVEDDGQFGQALRIVQEAWVAEGDTGPAWSCPRCHEWIEEQFTECWNCGTSRSESDRVFPPADS